MKRILAAALMVACMCFGAVVLSGCSNSEQVIKDALTEELDQIKNQDEAIINDIATSSGVESFSEMGIEPKEFVKSMLTGFDYQLGDVKVNGDTATVDLTITSKNFSNFENEIQDLANTADPSKFDSLDEFMKHYGKEMMKIIDQMEPVQAEPFTVTYKKVDNTWTPDSSVEENLLKAMGMV